MKNFLTWLGQKSTLSGLIGLTVGASGALGADWATDPETVGAISEGVPYAALSLIGLLNMFVLKE
jgi:uncharacterized membrane protein YgdD (TMEM256/DUF423 family)